MVRRQQRAVQDLDVGILHGGLHRAVEQHRRGGEDDVRALADQRFERRLAVLRLDVGDHARLDLVAEHRLHAVLAQLVPVRPAGYLRRAVVDERHAHLLRRGVQNLAEQAGLLALLGHHQRDRLLLRAGAELIAQPVQVGADLGADDEGILVVAVDRQIDEERIAGGDLQKVAAGELVGRRKAEVRRLEVGQLLARPALAGLLAHQLAQLRKAALLGKPDVIDLRILVEVEELVVDAVFLVVGALGQDARDVRLHHRRAEVLQHADALVALDDVELVHVLQQLDRVADAVLDHAVVEHAPLQRELRAFVQQRHEIAGEGAGPPARVRADKAVGRHGDQPQADARQAEMVGDQLVQHGQIGVLTALQRGMIGLAAEFFGPGIGILVGAIVGIGHANRLLSLPERIRGTKSRSKGQNGTENRRITFRQTPRRPRGGPR